MLLKLNILNLYYSVLEYVNYEIYGSFLKSQYILLQICINIFIILHKTTTLILSFFELQLVNKKINMHIGPKWTIPTQAMINFIYHLDRYEVTIKILFLVIPVK